ncbi:MULTISPECIES: GMC family oxidoreductase [unclassified Mesorhizobium]|uniref:GMC family oxidoreductase n=2 Tax=Mesorhizobium TaxID=68287 RepID=UPI000F7570F1|nr:MULTISPECIES: choline dehydrogenase [unclassified Mesorhizobium]AZO64307.1 choline dehydrogenase [Mesorhizobium sp. M6A.T.Cr.TU.016.01.1.1]RUU30755.1 choline dehydrogenase [Mesorhizobium sp. M6A.T.Ce.TU.016.01.1.1]RUU46327.1 choline dehydrogenase [Mesorhizobium sp. M6A.T.Ce.TU.002.03.1.1]RUV04394.1 choline dehydrogenase [Mesorhizobium sp. M6A.T.Cr.TU.017.01.1.1]RWP56426.1 MAG: choline dehydrogenase [Mesorhizobium sp.]
MAATKTFDFIIIGAGSAGCVLANRLSADPANKVLLLEAGGRDLNPLFRLPMLMGKLFHSGIYNWHYHTEPEPHLNGRSLYWPRGKVLGGTSTINGMIYVRGNRHDYDRWAQMGATGWSYDEVLPAFLRSETHVQRNGAYHNAEGELTVCRARGWNSLLDVFHEAGGQAGYPHNDDFNGEEQEGFGRYDFTIAKGKRCSAAYAFLRPAKKRPNLTIITRAHTRRILIENGQAVGVEFSRKGNISRAYADRQVILSAGVVNSPQILMLSGIGAADELAQHDIPVVQDLPGVGKNLQDHVDCVMAYECREPVTLYSDLRADKLTWSVIQGMLFGEGIATTFPYEAGAFVKSRTDLAAPDIQLHFMPALEKTANLHFPNPFKKERVEANHGFSLRVGPVNPESRGEIRLRSADPMDRPRINANYLQTEFDIRTMINAIRMTRDIIKQKAFEKYRGKELAPGPAVESDAEMVKWLRTNAMTTFHPVGTCKMGNDPMAVVDARLKVHGIEGLRVADASIMPIISSGNTNAPSIMIGERAAEFILDEASR